MSDDPGKPPDKRDHDGYPITRDAHEAPRGQLPFGRRLDIRPAPLPRVMGPDEMYDGRVVRVEDRLSVSRNRLIIFHFTDQCVLYTVERGGREFRSGWLDVAAIISLVVPRAQMFDMSIEDCLNSVVDIDFTIQSSAHVQKGHGDLVPHVSKVFTRYLWTTPIRDEVKSRLF